MKVRKPSIISLRKKYPFLTILTDEELSVITATSPIYKRKEYFRYVFDKEIEVRKSTRKNMKILIAGVGSIGSNLVNNLVPDLVIGIANHQSSPVRLR